MRLCALCALFLGLSSLVAARADETGIDRPGSDYKNFDLQPPAPGTFGGPIDVCRISCERDDACKAWTFVKVGVQGPKARCWLKNAIPGKVANSCCTSGVPEKSFETRVDRPGGDYNNFDLAAASPELCKSACERDGTRCRAWTYVAPGFQGPKARCWLKNVLPEAFTNACCVSGAHFIGPN